jgi:hypothetical protein
MVERKKCDRGSKQSINRTPTRRQNGIATHCTETRSDRMIEGCALRMKDIHYRNRTEWRLLF